MEKSQKRLILFMPSMDGGGVEKNIIIDDQYIGELKGLKLLLDLKVGALDTDWQMCCHIPLGRHGHEPSQ